MTVRLARLPAGSPSIETLRGKEVVSATGKSLGRVASLLADKETRQIRFVMLGAIAVPWRSVYLDATWDRLVFYTYDEKTNVKHAGPRVLAKAKGETK